MSDGTIAHGPEGKGLMAATISKPEHEVAYQELTALVARHAGSMTAIEVLAVAANMVGKLVALQDQRSTTPGKAMEVVARNIELGNAQTVEALMKSAGNG